MSLVVSFEIIGYLDSLGLAHTYLVVTTSLLTEESIVGCWKLLDVA